MRNIKKSLSFLMIFIILICSFTGCEKKEEKQTIVDTQISDLIINTDKQIDRLLNIDSLENYNIVGYMAEDIVYGLKNMPSAGFIMTMKNSMENKAIQNELKIRGFSQGRNNILFVGNNKFYNQQELNKIEIKEVQPIFETEIINNLPELKEKTISFEEKGYYNFQYYKTTIKTEDNKQVMETVYLIGQDTENKYKILDTIYFIDGEKTRGFQSIDLNKIESFAPNTFEREGTTNLGQIDRIIEKTEVYQGSIPYVEQNLEENNKQFER